MPEEKILGMESEGKAPEALPEKQDGAEAVHALSSQEKAAHIESRTEQSAGKYDEILSQVVSASAASAHADDTVASDAKSIGAITDEESKIRQLLDLAGTKGVVYAVKVARSLQDYYALDRVHDDLADKLYAGLLERGLIQKD
ncbi:MAG: hypothetical protein AAB547_00020 [Patescibacteria group bacterium]